VLAHHREEEQELFAAVLASAAEGAEYAEVAAMISRLTTEHHEIEAAFARLIPAIKAAGNGLKKDLNVKDLNGLVVAYLAHARFEEQVFLPMAKTILGRNAKHMEALGLSLHIRHNADEIRRNFGVL
jgi:hemerythrin-like domain-containing protein